MRFFILGCANSTTNLPKHTSINNYFINLVDFKSSADTPMMPIYKKNDSFQLCV